MKPDGIVMAFFAREESQIETPLLPWVRVQNVRCRSNSPKSLRNVYSHDCRSRHPVY